MAVEMKQVYILRTGTPARKHTLKSTKHERTHTTNSLTRSLAHLVVRICIHSYHRIASYAIPFRTPIRNL